jgi:hypothetical protein
VLDGKIEYWMREEDIEREELGLRSDSAVAGARERIIDFRKVGVRFNILIRDEV